VILTQGHGKCWAEDPTGQVLSQGQPSSRGLTLWHASQQSVPPKN
jgi:hypothetical protein